MRADLYGRQSPTTARIEKAATEKIVRLIHERTGEGVAGSWLHYAQHRHATGRASLPLGGQDMRSPFRIVAAAAASVMTLGKYRD